MSNFTVIHHDVRLKMGLSCNEYCVGDLIFRLSNGTDDGWCFASRSKLGEMMGLSKPSIITILSILIKLDLVECHPKTKDLRVTKTWSKFFPIGKDSLPIDGQDSLPKRERFYKKRPESTGKESLRIGKDSLQCGQDSLPKIGQDSLPPSYKEILLELELKEEKGDFSKTEENISLDSLKEKKEKPSKVAPKVSFNACDIDLPFSTMEFKEAWDMWVTARKEKKKPVSEAASKLSLDLLRKYDAIVATQMILNSVKNDWQGIFELKSSDLQKLTPNPQKGNAEKNHESLMSAFEELVHERGLTPN